MSYRAEFSIRYDETKNKQLIRERDISFETVIALITDGEVLDVIEHPNQTKYKHQYVLVLDIEGYCYYVPFVADSKGIFLKTIIPSRKLTKQYGPGGLK